MMPPRLDHGLAGAAADTIDQARERPGGRVSDEVITRLKGLPALLRTSGPLATLAFFAAKASEDKKLGPAYAVVGQALREQVRAELPQLSPDADQDSGLTGFVRSFTGERVTPGDLARATARLEAFASWLRRLAEAVEHEQEQQDKRKQRKQRTTVAGDAEQEEGAAPDADPDTGDD